MPRKAAAPSRVSHETKTAVVDATVTMKVAEDGSVDRGELVQTAMRRDTFANIAIGEWRDSHPGTAITDENRYQAIADGLIAIGERTVDVLLAGGHLQLTGPGRVRLTAKRIKVDGKFYDPGDYAEETRFRSARRRITPGRKALIEESIRVLGDLRKYFPVLLDDQGNVVDGAHRRAIDPDWPALDKRLRVPRAQRVAAVIAGNRSSVWDRDEWQRLRQGHEQETGRQDSNRQLIRLALLEDANRSNVVVGKLVGADDVTVGKVRRELEATSEIQRFEFKGGTDSQGRGKRTGQLAPPRADVEDRDVDPPIPSPDSPSPVPAVADEAVSPAQHEHRWMCCDCGQRMEIDR